MKKNLIDVIFASQKRMNVLLLLKEGPREIEELLACINTNRQTLLPQMKVLKEHHLILHENDTCELSTIGKLIVHKLVPLSNLTNVIDSDVDYWGTHDLNFIPSHLLERINELGTCRILHPPLERMHEVHAEFNEISKDQKFQYSITTFFYPHFLEIFAELTANKVNMHVIISQVLFDRLKTQNIEELKEIISNKLVHLYVYRKKMDFLSFVFNENTVMMSPLSINRDFDNKHIICKSPDAVRWAREVFEHYLKNSIQIISV